LRDVRQRVVDLGGEPGDRVPGTARGGVAALSLLRKVQALAEQAPGLSDGQLKAQALSLLAELDQHARTWPG
jgi:hypothetical protein